jgi:hypothetical protein
VSGRLDAGKFFSLPQSVAPSGANFIKKMNDANMLAAGFGEC